MTQFSIVAVKRKIKAWKWRRPQGWSERVRGKMMLQTEAQRDKIVKQQ